MLYLVLVQSCNFACSYCPIPELGRETGNALMTPATARVAVDMWASHVRDDEAPDAEYCAILYGGEPLLNEPALRAAIEHIERAKPKGSFPEKTSPSWSAPTACWSTGSSRASSVKLAHLGR